MNEPQKVTCCFVHPVLGYAGPTEKAVGGDVQRNFCSLSVWRKLQAINFHYAVQRSYIELHTYVHKTVHRCYKADFEGKAIPVADLGKL